MKIVVALLLVEPCKTGGPQVLAPVSGGVLLPDQADPFGGIIKISWYIPPATPHERLKVSVFILDSRLRRLRRLPT
ncbi:MAG: DUF3576 domain-containing protein [Alphaproteobacteria bacterium]|nr:DUF3576 domain-containing protein [Alphaproteobacteria bacterium]